MEIIGNRELTYLYAQGTPFAIHEKDGETEQLYYLHLDYQGSIRAITDEAGAVVETRCYLYVNNVSYLAFPGARFITRLFRKSPKTLR
jgi:hypothetical protein